MNILSLLMVADVAPGGSELIIMGTILIALVCGGLFVIAAIVVAIVLIVRHTRKSKAKQDGYPPSVPSVYPPSGPLVPDPVYPPATQPSFQYPPYGAPYNPPGEPSIPQLGNTPVDPSYTPPKGSPDS